MSDSDGKNAGPEDADVASSSDSNSDDEVYESEVERRWGEATSIEGIDPSLMHARLRREHLGDEPEPAAFSPWLIPYAAVMAGPLVAALVALLADGDPPKPRQAIAVLATGATAWAINIGLFAEERTLISAGADAAAHLGVLFGSGALLWAMYVYWLKGKVAIDQRGLTNTIVALVAVSAIFWLGRDTTWLTWLGR